MSAHRSNPADLLQTYTLAELERISTTLQDGVGFTIPVDIENVLEKQVGVDLDIWPKLAANHKLLSMAGIDIHKPGIIFVFIDDGLADNASMENRYRMTIAEELAHIILHRKAIEAVSSPEDFKAIQHHPHWYLYERNAKWLAAAVLIPADHLMNDARCLYEKLITSLPKQFRFTNPEAVKKQLITLLARHYKVSVQSMEFRLKDWPLNIISKIDEAMRKQLDFLP